MSQKLDPREVLAYLNHLGYTNITVHQLKEFMRDLKKLIKYDQRKTESVHHEVDTNYKENLLPNSEIFSKSGMSTDYTNCRDDNVNDCLNKFDENCSCEYCGKLDIFTQLHNHHTVASRARLKTMNEKQITLHISKPKTRVVDHPHCTHVEVQVQTGSHDNYMETDASYLGDKENTKRSIETESTIRNDEQSESKASSRGGSKPSTSKSTLKSKVSPKKNKKISFIRPHTAPPVNRSDPVALYHHYQSEWKKQKFPGEDNRSDLRWAVRAKMLGASEFSSVRRCQSRI